MNYDKKNNNKFNILLSNAWIIKVLWIQRINSAHIVLKENTSKNFQLGRILQRENHNCVIKTLKQIFFDKAKKN